MLRACRKNTLHMRELKNPYFEEAFFILRHDMPRGAADSLSAEAERIAAECFQPAAETARRRRRAAVKRAMLFLSGSMAGATVSAGIMLCLGIA